MQRKRIGVDFDDVLADFCRYIVAMYNAKHGTSHKVETMDEIYLDKLWGGSREEAVDFVNDYFPFTGETPPIKGVKEALETLAKDHELILITGRPETAMEVTHGWLETHLPGIFKTTYFTNQFTDPEKMSKAKFCKAHGIDVMIDDFRGTALDMAAAGIPVLLFDQPWNQGEMPSGVTRVHSWQEVLQNI